MTNNRTELMTTPSDNRPERIKQGLADAGLDPSLAALVANVIAAETAPAPHLAEAMPSKGTVPAKATGANRGVAEAARRYGSPASA